MVKYVLVFTGQKSYPGDHLEGYFERIGDSATVLISRIQHPADFASAVDSIQSPHELVVRQGQVSSVKCQVVIGDPNQVES